jgi:predicted metalloprotease
MTRLRSLSFRLVMILTVAVVLLPIAPAAAIGAREMQRELEDIASDVDRFWSETAAEYDMPYYPPEVVYQVGEFTSGCGDGGQYAMYCAYDETVYLDPAMLASDNNRTGGSGISIATVSHEWGHHLTFLWLEESPDRVDYRWLNDREVRWELLADCLAGVYMGHAWAEAPADDGQLLAVIRDQSTIGSAVHGTGDERVVAFMSGYVEGFAGCDFVD